MAKAQALTALFVLLLGPLPTGEAQDSTELLRVVVDAATMTTHAVRLEALRRDDETCVGTWYSVGGDFADGAVVEALHLEMRLGPRSSFVGALRETGCPAISAALTWRGGDHALLRGEVTVTWLDPAAGTVLLTFTGTAMRDGHEVPVRGEVRLRLPDESS